MRKNSSKAFIIIFGLLLSLALVLVTNHITLSVGYSRVESVNTSEKVNIDDYMPAEHNIHYTAGLPFKSQIQVGKTIINISPICNSFTCPAEGRYLSSEKDVKKMLLLAKTPQFFLNWLVYFVLVSLPVYLVVKKIKHS